MCVRVCPWYNDSVRATKCLIRQLERIWRTTGLECDTQIYITVKPLQEDIDAAVETIEQCVAEIRSWMKTNSWKWNDSKTEVIVYGIAEQLNKFTLQSLRVGDCVVRVTDSVRNLGVQFDAEMTMESQVTAVCRSAIFHLRNISRIKRYLTAAATEHIVHAFVTNRLDIGNALLYRLPLKQTQRLQKLQNCAARLIEVTLPADIGAI